MVSATENDNLTGTESDDVNHLNKQKRKKAFIHALGVQAKKNELVDVGDGDYARREDIEFDKVANARGKHMFEGFAKLESLLEGDKDNVAENRVTKAIDEILSEADEKSISLKEIACVKEFCRVNFDGATLDSTVAFLDEIKFNKNLAIASSEFSPEIELNAPENAEPDPATTPATTKAYFSMDLEKLPVNPTDFNLLEIPEE